MARAPFSGSTGELYQAASSRDSRSARRAAHTEALCDEEGHLENQERDDDGRVPGGEGPDEGQREGGPSDGVDGDEERDGPEDPHDSPHRHDDAEERHEQHVGCVEGRQGSAGQIQ